MKKHRETVEEFLARGGVIQVIPPQTPPEVPIMVKATSTPDNNIMSLDEGAHYFAENRKGNKPAKKTLLKDVVDNYGLPKEIVDRLRGVNV
jgi:hypothetical protein